MSYKPVLQVQADMSCFMSTALAVLLMGGLKSRSLPPAFPVSCVQLHGALPSHSMCVSSPTHAQTPPLFFINTPFHCTPPAPLPCVQGLHWMLSREQQGDAAGRGTLHLHPGWLQLVNAQGQVFYVHRLAPHWVTRTLYPAPVGGTCGGFLCDEMGL